MLRKTIRWRKTCFAQARRFAFYAARLFSFVLESK